MSSNSQKAIVALCGAAAATAIYVLSTSSKRKLKDPAPEGGNQATAKVETPKETLATTAVPTEAVTKETADIPSSSASSVAPVASIVDAVKEKARLDVVSVVQEQKEEPTKAATNIVATTPISTQTPETMVAEEESVEADENKKPVQPKNSTQNDTKSLDTNKDDADAVQTTTAEIDHATGEDSTSDPAVDVSAILKARKNAAKNGKGKSKNTAASAAIKELKNSQQQQGKNKKKKSKNWQ